jgi:DNA-binding beta-propeller fold protein YncE
LNKALVSIASAAVLLTVGRAMSSAPAAPRSDRTSARASAATPRVDVEPANGLAFAGASLRFHARVVGGTDASSLVGWKSYGDGSIDESGIYRAPPSPGGAASIVATIGGSVGGARVSVATPPAAGAVQALVACYADGSLDVRGDRRADPFGRLLVGDSVGDVALDARTSTAVATSGDRLISIDLLTMIAKKSAPLNEARLGGVALLAGGAFAVATNENAESNGAGIAVYRLHRGAAPQLVSTAPAGETPEGIAIADDGRTMYVAAVNGNVVTRLVLNRDGTAKKTGAARTGTRPFGVAIDARDGVLFVADNDTPTLSGAQSRPGLEEFSLPALRRIGAAISTGSPNALPLGVAVDPDSRRLFVTNEGDDDVAVYALPSLHRVATLRVGRTPWLPAVDVRRHQLYVPNARDDSFDVLDTRTLAHVRIGVPTCAYPVGVAVESAPPAD